ncbi:DUF6012 family protein [Pseudomonas lopnurensis]|uniref:DUF6012 family protein n=1 Tax=Pseudomonas lopnurensis TaxID=1477517 RepID=UPI0028ADBFAC|nr:DUF6012 family protein [Pseudomonas lopnurensis]
MLIHLVPRFLTCELSGYNCEVVDIRIAELGLHLRGGNDLTTRRPYPNKMYQVACRKIGRRAIEGILIETAHPVSEFTAVIRWAVRATHVLTHRIIYKVQDEDHDATSEAMVLWGNYTDLNPAWVACRVQQSEDFSPAAGQPCMDARPFSVTSRKGHIEDRMHGDMVGERIETFHLPTLDRDRILNHPYWSNRIPPLDHAFKSDELAVPEW